MHFGKALNAVPPPNTVLLGDPPAIGLLRLQEEHASAPCPLALVLLNFKPDVAAKLVAPINLL